MIERCLSDGSIARVLLFFLSIYCTCMSQFLAIAWCYRERSTSSCIPTSFNKRNATPQRLCGNVSPRWPGYSKGIQRWLHLVGSGSSRCIDYPCATQLEIGFKLRSLFQLYLCQGDQIPWVNFHQEDNLLLEKRFSEGRASPILLHDAHVVQLADWRQTNTLYQSGSSADPS
jgi:hypothetical protein